MSVGIAFARTLGIVLLLVVLQVPARVEAQVQESEIETNARLQRRSAGLRVGTWSVRGLEQSEGVSDSRTPTLEGYFRKGLDRHLALETTVTIWRRSQESTSSGIGGSTTESVDSYIVPMFTALKVFPFTGPDQRFEPFFDGGVGLAIGIDDRNLSRGGLLGGTGGGLARVPGFGFRGGAGAEWRFSRAFGLSVGGRYQWVRFTQDLGGDRTYAGFGMDGGLLYRFQFR